MVISASDGTNTLKSTFIMESKAPAVPPPLLPEMGVKAEALTHFDWEDVTDDSPPVTYALQIATDEEFTKLVLEKTDLSESEYTLTEGEQLESTKEEAPYYWRVKAVSGLEAEGDLEESEWSAGVFTTMEEPVVIEPEEPAPPPVIEPVVEVIIPAEEVITPSWIYIIIGVGALLVIAVIVLIVRTRRVA